MSKECIIIAGAGGFGREVLSYIKDLQQAGTACAVKGFIDDNLHALDGRSIAEKILGAIDDYEVQHEDRFVIAVGDCRVRKDIRRRLSAKGAPFFTVIHPLSYIAPRVQLGSGSILCPFTSIGPDAVIGENVVLNTYASCGHDSRIADFCVLSPYAVTNGGVSLDEGVFLGTHAVVAPGKRVGAWSKISAGSVAMRDIEAGSLAAGISVAARVMYHSDSEGDRL